MKRLTCTLLLAMILLTMPWAIVPAMARRTYFEVLLIGEDDAPLDTVQAGEHPNGRADALMLLSLCLDDGAYTKGLRETRTTAHAGEVGEPRGQLSHRGGG
ncbi:MAG: hypothetical protein RSC06_13580 [Clostridia bacterium]